MSKHTDTPVVRDGVTLSEGDVISLDGTTGEVFLGAVPVAELVPELALAVDGDPATEVPSAAALGR